MAMGMTMMGALRRPKSEMETKAMSGVRVLPARVYTTKHTRAVCQQIKSLFEVSMHSSFSRNTVSTKLAMLLFVYCLNLNLKINYM